ncbi:STY0301 family protein [Janthinobacterium sp. LB3P118]
MTLSQRLPNSVKKCTLIYHHGQKAGQHDIRIRCIG